ncbi:methyl-accepting chemotaxis sensory transducer with Cache sensor [Pseudobutyrivibrio sp. JW11]|uniref:methyl-accepting chemotaxis protein n=1 Tax=Pseudobutyrivibrio sp. JW11 TaxID=1855302 RepID=UPI0008EC2291|nr:methyl-accepting chemotaxis protein [Pseudobutyrivibrio sp. JW11]SFN77350.1 methyl-accepting chemotaxis sensory transducer with Cache sensor [Pseudobutyrivibrio sp. JW11]
MANTKNKARRKKIKNKLIFLLLPVVIVTILVLVGIATVLSRNSMTEMATAQLDSSISNQADNIEAWLDENLENFSTVKQVIEKTQPDEEGLQKILDSFYGFNKYCTEGPYVATADGRFYAASASGLRVTNPTGETFFKQGITSVNMNYGTAYTNDEGTSVISASGILNDGSGELKVIAADLSLDQISIIVNSGVKMDSAASFLIDASDNTILAHRDPERISTTLTTSDSDKLMAAIAERLETRDYDTVALNGYEVAFREIQGTDWVLVSYIADSVILKDVMKLTNLLIIVGIIAVIVIVIMINLLVSKVIAPLGHITKNITDMSAGDFTIEVKQESDDEIGLMGSKVSEFVESMRTMLSTINEESEKLKEQSDNSDRVSKDMFEASRSQADAMQNLNSTVDQLAVAVNEIAENATTLAMVVSDTRENSNQANESMKETVEISKKGRDDMEQLSVAMQGIKNSNDELVNKINDVGKASEEITKIVGLIAEIADETNLLSLNASIEAARAGEAGKGFAVVASEIGKLAQNSAASADNISRLINDVQKAINSVVEQAEASAENIDANSQLIDTAVDTFDQIYQNIEKSNELLDLMIQDVEKVDDVAGNVAAISEEQAASADEILETSHHMVEQANSITASSQDVADNSHELASTSDTLSAYVQQFKI